MSATSSVQSFPALLVAADGAAGATAGASRPPTALEGAGVALQCGTYTQTTMYNDPFAEVYARGVCVHMLYTMIQSSRRC
jgi:hypothetical protein